MALDTGRMKTTVIALWRQGGGDTLVKVMPAGVAPSAHHDVGYCTTIKYIAGRTPAEMEANVGFRVGSKLATGADVYLVRPLPNASQFELRGYSHTPEGIPTNVKPAHPDYPPGLGVPQWRLVNYPQDRLVLLAKVGPGQRFVIPYNTLLRPQ